MREGRIESRRLVTDTAILEAVRRLDATRVLDLGCGEGWLCRALSQQGMEVVGVDASAALIAAAKALGGTDYRVLSYEDLAAHPGSVPGPFEAVVCNFSLLGEALEPLLSTIASLLAPRGALVIQTVHPWAACGDAPYRSGWRSESFSSFGEGFKPMPWYYRTLSSWVGKLAKAGFLLRQLDEPLHPATGKPLSLLMVCSLHS